MFAMGLAPEINVIMMMMMMMTMTTTTMTMMKRLYHRCRHAATHGVVFAVLAHYSKIPRVLDPR